MAGGIDWFRWHHGSVTDPKFALVARKSGASLPDVLAVWAYILERASAAEERGHFGQIDCEAVDCLFNFPSAETRTADILKAMEQRELTANGRIAAWETRQPKREREGDNSTERVREHRERKRQGTPRNAGNGTETPRGEERRVDINTPPAPKGEASASFERFWNSWPAHSRKVAKDQCRAKWESKECEPHADAIVAHVEASKRSDKWREDGGQYIPAPLVYLNQKRWEAPVAPASAPSTPPPTVPSRAADHTADYLREQQMTPKERQASAAAAREARERIAKLKGGMTIGSNA